MASAAGRASPDGSIAETGYDAVFEPELERKYMCPVCLAVLRDPVQTKCGHRFCKVCLKQSSGPNARFAKCPVDNTWLDVIKGTFDDVAMKREVLSLTVRCRHHTEDCDWLGELRDLKAHEETCPRTFLDCINDCGNRIRREDIEDHLMICTQRLERCSHCETDVVVADMTKHQLLVCPRFPVECAICRKAGLLREDIPRHVDLTSGDCPLVTVKCAFHHLGCYYQGLRQDQADHHTEATQHHLTLLSARLARQDELLARQDHQLRAVIAAARKLSELASDQRRQLCQTSVALRSHAHRLTDLQQSGCTGRLLWKINLPEDNTCQLRSPYFYTGRPGYRLSLTLELAGFRNNDEIYSSIYVNLEKGDYDDELKFPFEGVCHVTLHDQSEDPDVRTTFSTSILCSRVPRCYDNGSVPSGRHQRGRLKLMRTADLLDGAFVDQRALLLQVEALHFHADHGSFDFL